MRKRSLTLVMIAGLIATTFVASPVTAMGDTGQNEIRVTIYSWWFWGETPTDTMDVSFTIAFDMDNDGAYEQVNESVINRGANGLWAPFHASCYVDRSVQNVGFQVLAIKHNGTVTTVLDYGYPTAHTASNVDRNNDSWQYAGHNNEQARPDTCVISYGYYVLPVYDLGPGTETSTAASGGGLSFDLNEQAWVLIFAMVAVACLLTVAGLYAYVSRSRSKLFSPMPRWETRVPREGPDFCHHCGKLFPGDVEYCPYCGVKKMG